MHCFNTETETVVVQTLEIQKRRFNKLTSVFHASVLLLIINFVITSKVAVDPRGDSRVDPQTTLTK